MRLSASSYLWVLGVGAVVLSLQSCGDEKAESLRSTGTALDGRNFSDPEFACNNTPPASADLFLDAAAPNYKDDIAALLATNCVTCHRPGGNFPDLSTLDQAMLESGASLNAIEAGRMPKSGPLPAADQALFRAWVDGGTPAEAPAPVGDDDGAATDAGGDDGAGDDGTSADATPAESCPAPVEAAP